MLHKRITFQFPGLLLVLAASLIFAPAVCGQQPPKPTATPDVVLISLPQIADEAMQLRQRLRTSADRLAPEPLLAGIEQEANGLRDTTGARAQETEAMIKSGLTIAELQQLLRDWQALNRQVAGLAETLGKQATAAEAETLALRDERTRWEQTYHQIKQDKSTPELIAQVDKALEEIRAAGTLADEQRNRIIALQQTVAAQGSIISGEIASVNKAMADSLRSLLEPDSQPIWKAQFRPQTDQPLVRLLRKSYDIDLLRLKNFLDAKRRALIGIALLIAAALAFFVRLRERTKALPSGFTGPAERSSVFQRPASLALLVGLVATMPLLYEAPISARGIVDILAVIPILRLLQPRLKASFRKMLFTLIASVLVWEAIKLIQFPLWIKRDLLMALCVVMAAAFLWLARSAKREGVELQPGSATVIIAVRVGVLLIVVSLLANVFGYFGLSDLIGNGALVGGYRAVALYTVFVVGAAIISLLLQTETARRLAMIRIHADLIGRWLSFALALILLFTWIRTALNLFAIRDAVYHSLDAAFNYQITIGTASFTPGNIVIFLLTLFFGYLIAAGTRAILGEEILPRLKLERGLPNAIATITHYVALLLVFLLALAAAGVHLSKFAILTGAFGVGIGFGMQNVVNNFFSGLILLFERPIRVGDYLDIGEISGEVTKIGFRSSTLHTFDGADLIVPNGSLISQQVINWTLSGTRRRIFLPVRVAYGNNPEQVCDLLLATAAAHPDVLGIPKPMVLFLGFGESALDFEVCFWSPRTEMAPVLKSEVALLVAAALRNAGIEVPVPQRDLHLKSVAAPAWEALAVSANGNDDGRKDATNA
ncbi:MAG: mechanosensitive ion channel [Acidobacteria bacterium]|nr:mechanosensitive ion channel [Acidobacteriota bacterium]